MIDNNSQHSNLDSKINPKHYQVIPGMQAIDICRNLDFCLGNAVKYLMRAEYKDDTITDLQKAIWYLEEAIKDNHPETKRSDSDLFDIISRLYEYLPVNIAHAIHLILIYTITGFTNNKWLVFAIEVINYQIKLIQVKRTVTGHN